jgi:ketosteroid isomerase-like protein
MSTTTPTTAREIVEAAYAAIGSGDVDAFIALLADDCVLEEPAGHPAGGTWTGPDAIREAFPGIAGALGLRGVSVTGIVAEGDTAIGLIDVLLTSRSGAESTMSVAEVWEVRDGKAVRIRPHYWDTVALQQLASS